MSDIALKIENVSKQYRLGEIGTGTLSHDLNRWWHIVRGKEDPYLKVGETNDRSVKGDSRYVWALKEINFEVKKGEILGVIGKNGAGKSTLLKVLSKVTAPATGTIKAKGRIASLLEVGTGFHPEMTGRENIFMNGTIMGMSRSEINRKLDEIVEFAGVAKYLDTPVKRYSSGMKVRLGFAIAAHLDPEILIVDEVLAVGDAEFQKKAIGKMQDVSKDEGRTVLFVSHNMDSIKNLCTSSMVLKNGTVDFIGGVAEGISHYLKVYNEKTNFKMEFDRDSNKVLSLNSIRLVVNDDNPEGFIDVFDSIGIEIDYFVNNPDLKGVSIYLVVSLEGTPVFGTFDTTHSPNLFDGRKRGRYTSRLNFPKPFLKPGKYTVDISVGYPRREVIQKKEDCLSFEVILSSRDNFDVAYSKERVGFIVCDEPWETNLIDNED